MSANNDPGGESLESGDFSSGSDGDNTLQNTAKEIGVPGGGGALGQVDAVAADNSGKCDGDVQQVSRTRSSERESNEDGDEDTVLAGATPKKRLNVTDIDNSLFDMPRSSSTPFLKRGRPRQNLNSYNPDIIPSGESLRQTFDRLIKSRSPASSPVRRSGREKKEISRFGNPVDHTKKPKKTTTKSKSYPKLSSEHPS